MAMDATEIERMIKEALPDSNCRDQGLWRATETITPRMSSHRRSRGKTRIQQHQIVYAALKGNMGGVLHALGVADIAAE